MTTAEALALAVALADRAVGRTAPNPPVGCVIVAGGQIVGEGFHRGAGQPHAEREALVIAGERARGATLYSTLEPCCHHGRTPPCTDAVIAAGVTRVVCAVRDPDPHVAGGGLAQLRAAGIEVILDDGDGAAAAQLRAYCHQRRTGRPWIRAKWAMTLDGRLATSAGSSRWVSGPAARAWVHEQRDRADAVLVGAGTVIADDPQLTVRLDDSPRPPRQPLRIVVDTAGRTPADARLFTDGAAPTLWVVGAAHRPPPRPGAEQLVLPELDGHIDLAALVAELGRRGLLDVLCEAGGGLTGALLRAGLIDEVAAIVAPKLVGGTGPTAWTGPGQEPMRAALELVDPEWRQLGRDILITGRLRNE